MVVIWFWGERRKTRLTRGRRITDARNEGSRRCGRDTQSWLDERSSWIVEKGWGRMETTANLSK